jgi:uncharacterized protein YkwD
MKLYTLFVNCSILSLFILPLAFANTWSPEMFLKYSADSFSKYAPAQQQIIIENIDYMLLNAALFYETNRRRLEHNLPEFRHSEAIEETASSHSRDMVEKKFFEHNSPIKGKRTLKDRLERNGIANAYIAENIAYLSALNRDPDRPLYTPEQNDGYFSYTYKGAPLANHTYLSLAKVLLDQWMNSKGHRENILNHHYTFLGCGAAHYKDGSFFNMDRFKATQNFSSKDAKREAK